MNNSVDKYLSPESGNKTTIFFPLFSYLLANLTAAERAAPALIPTKIPSFFPNNLANSKDSSVVAVRNSSIYFLSKVLGTKLAPIP